jgi:hypothetical protein
MSVNKASSAQLTEWEALLKSEGLGDPEKDLNYVSLRDTDGVRIPAQPVRDGGCFWRERAQINWGTEHRSRGSVKRPRLSFVCPACGKGFEGTKRARFCSRTCIDRFGKRRRRARVVPPNLRMLSEETSQ